MSPADDDLPEIFPPRPRRPFWLRLILLGGSILFLILGVVGTLIPVMPQVIFFVIGLLLLAGASERARAWLNRAERRFPHRFRLKLHHWMHRMRRKGTKGDEVLKP